MLPFGSHSAPPGAEDRGRNRLKGILIGRMTDSRGGPIHPEAGLSVPRRACPSRGGPVCREAGLYPLSGQASKFGGLRS
ncbi:hypothetical protein T484DRAFT_2179953 [Baffinella frigidus]|nr:hypothetical protein T484DRAFT_2179953 [Cryptophyta sp. CCMP2293]